MTRREYDPFDRGPFRVGVRTVQALDAMRGRLFPCDIWYPASGQDADRSFSAIEGRDAPALPGPHPLILYSHYSGGHRNSATFLCTHLAGHGYVVAAMDHSEVIAPDLGGREGETAEERAARIDSIIGSRVPDLRFLLDYVLDGATGDIRLDSARIGLVGHSFGGWSVLATPEVEPRVRSVVAMGPGGSSRPRPGVLPLTLTFEWHRAVSTLYLAAEDDVPIPLNGVIELFERTPLPKRMFILRRADHQHFVDDVENLHEAIRAMNFPGEAAWIPGAMRPIGELASGEQSHFFVRGLTLAHLDGTLRRMSVAEHFLSREAEAGLATRGIEGMEYRPDR